MQEWEIQAKEQQIIGRHRENVQNNNGRKPIKCCVNLLGMIVPNIHTEDVY